MKLNYKLGYCLSQSLQFCQNIFPLNLLFGRASHPQQPTAASRKQLSKTELAAQWLRRFDENQGLEYLVPVNGNSFEGDVLAGIQVRKADHGSLYALSE